jgi:hypothetical protein
MSRTIHGHKPPGFDWWSRRPLSGKNCDGSARMNAWWKRAVHKRERQAAVREIRREVTA